MRKTTTENEGTHINFYPLEQTLCLPELSKEFHRHEGCHLPYGAFLPKTHLHQRTWKVLELLRTSDLLRPLGS